MVNLSRRDFGKIALAAFGSAAMPAGEAASAVWPPVQPLDFTLNATPAASIDMGGNWKIATDSENKGKTEQWFERHPVANAVTTVVPNPLELTFPGYNGVVWYWRTFDSAELGEYNDIRIHFQGVDYYAEAWLNGKYLGGDESALLPFTFSLKSALRPGPNELVVRVIDASYAREIDGFRLGHVPGGRQADDPLQAGWRHYNYGGLLLPVFIQAFRRPWIADGFIQPNIKDSRIDIDLIIVGEGRSTEWNATVRPVSPQDQKPIVQKTIRISPDSQGQARISITIPNPRLWRIWDGFLYQLTLSPKRGSAAGTTWQQRFGMREVSIMDGRIAVNGEPILQRSFLYNQIWPVTLGVPFKDMARKDIELVRQVNANMLRCFSKTPLPATVMAADEVGILLQPESLASWYLENGEKEQERLKNITERGVLLYRNHPSILWWNILNENSPRGDPRDPGRLGPYALAKILPSVHALDPTRPTICDDPIWNDVPNIWEPGRSEPTLPLFQDHYYQFTALENHEDSWRKIRGRAWGEKPSPSTPFVAITEWGQNSSPEWNRLIQSYKSSGLREDAEDYVVNRRLGDMNRKWYEQSGISKRGFPTFESLGEANRQSVAERYREHFALYWGNIHSVGHGMTSLEDSTYELSGVVDIWRNPKPVVFEALRELNQPLQINLWLRPTSLYANDNVTFDATLVNEGHRLPPGGYSLLLKIIDAKDSVVFTKQYDHQVEGQPIEFLLFESVPLAVNPGYYQLQLELEGKNNNLKAARPLRVFERKPHSLNLSSPVWIWEKGDQLRSWLEMRGVAVRPGVVTSIMPGDLMIVAEVSANTDAAKGIQQAVQQGAHAIILKPEAVLPAKEEGKTQSPSDSDVLYPIIPLGATGQGEWKPELREISWWGNPGAWGYSRTALALQHPFLEGLPQAVALEAQPEYQRIAPKYTWFLAGVPALAAVDSAVVESALNVDTAYTADLFRAVCGQGTLVLNTLHIAENLNADPAADLILENMLRNLREP